MYLGLSVENTTANDVSFNLAGRYLAFDVVGPAPSSGSTRHVGSQPSVGAALYRPLGSTPFFVEPFAGIDKRTLNYITGRPHRRLLRPDAQRRRLRCRGQRRPARRRSPAHAHGPARREGGDRRPRAAGSERRGNGARPAVDPRRAGQPGRPVSRRPLTGVRAALRERARAAGRLPQHARDRGRHAGRVGRVVVLVGRHAATGSRLPVRGRRHVVRRAPAADRAVRARRPVPARRLQHRASSAATTTCSRPAATCGR